MLRRIGVALAAVMLLLPLTVVAQKSGRSRSSSSSSTRSTSPKRKSTSTKSASHHTYLSKKSTFVPRAANGKIKRSVVDHIVPLECGGVDIASNMQWQTVQEVKIKDRTERNCRRE
jgi:hypothetical protein